MTLKESGFSDPNLFSAPDISFVDSHFRDPYIIQGSLQVEGEVLSDTVVTIGTAWTHGVHLLSSSAYDLNLQPPVGQTTYVVCPQGAAEVDDCNGPQVVMPNLDGASDQSCLWTNQCPDLIRRE
jgi:hypothetical protein